MKDMLPLSMRMPALVGLWTISYGGMIFAQTFGGAPPWGTEKPVKIAGEVHQGESFEQPIGGGLSFRLEPASPDWEIAVGPSRTMEDFSMCATGPQHGPGPRDLLAWHFARPRDGAGGVGEKRRITFALNSRDDMLVCDPMDSASDFPATGACLFTPLNVRLNDSKDLIEDLKFDAECGLYGGIQLWRLPATYVIPDRFTGWITVYFGEKGQPELPGNGDHVVLRIGALPVFLTSTILRMDKRGVRFISPGGAPLATEGPGRMIWGAENGYADSCSYSTFFVGTEQAWRRSGSNPQLRTPYRKCQPVTPPKP